MTEEKYSFTRLPEEYFYEFFSEGPKGKIKKIVRYRLIQDKPYKIFNLGFGDWDEMNNDVDDKVASNNNDRQKVLATVAETVMEFTKDHPNVSVFAQGSTPARTRLYQMGITSFWNEIRNQFVVIGYSFGEWRLFEKGKNYEAFLVKRKQ